MSYSPPTPAPLRGHLPALDAVRGLAVIVVTCYRFRETTDGDASVDFARFFLDRGHHGVDLFFVLSGFLITGILDDTRDSGDYFARFYRNRVLRIFPLYYLSLLLGLVVLPWLFPQAGLALTTPPPDSGWIWCFGTNVVQCWRNAWTLDPYNHFWSLAVEEHFYLAWPLVIWFTTRKQAVAICLGCVAVGFISRIVAVLAFNSLVAAEVFTLCRIDALAVGCWLALVAREPEGLRRLVTLAPRIALATIGLSLGMFAVSRLATTEHSLGRDLISASVFFPFALLSGAGLVFALTSAHPWTSRFRDSRLLALAGKYSYGWYVLQGMFTPDYTRLFTHGYLAQITFLPPLAKLAINILLGGGISLLLAILTWHGFERHFLKWKQKAPATEPTQAAPMEGVGGSSFRTQSESPSILGGR